MNLDRIKNIHFVGIGGIGMSGLAAILADAGHHVSGCDAHESNAGELLAGRGVDLSIGHDPKHLEGIDLVVVTAAVKPGNPEIDAAHARGIRVARRSEVLGEIVGRKRSIGVSGTHGKTTTSALVATILEEAGLDPTVIVGGVLRNLGSNAKTGKGDLLVVEADEYDRTFHHLNVEIAVVTNIEADHLEYFGSLDAIHEAFEVYLRGVRRDGVIIACVDDFAVVRVLRRLESGSEHEASPRIVRYGLREEAELRAINLQFHDRGSSFEVPGVGFFKLFVPGEHNVRNALAAIGVALELGVDPAVIRTGLAKFLGVNRRFEILGDYAGAIIVDDYAHHPTEIRATINAARSGYPGRRIVALFQPHLFSRTRDFAGEFAAALATADVAIVAPVFAAREVPIEGISARLIAEAGEGIEFIDRSLNGIFNEMRRRIAPNDIFITMGAGDIHEVAEMLVRGTVEAVTE